MNEKDKEKRYNNLGEALMNEKDKRKRYKNLGEASMNEQENNSWAESLHMTGQNPVFNVNMLDSADKFALEEPNQVAFSNKTPEKVSYSNEELDLMREPVLSVAKTNERNMDNEKFVPEVLENKEENPFIFGNLGSEMEEEDKAGAKMEEDEEWLTNHFSDKKGGKRKKTRRRTKKSKKSKRKSRKLRRKTKRRHNRK